jgi:hypothetical protein
MAFRLLRYEVRIWEAWRNDNPAAKRLPAILPIVVHHSDAGWTGELAFEALLDVDPELFHEIAPFVPRFSFLLDDLSGVSDEALRDRAMSALGRLSFWCLKNARTPEQLVRGLRGLRDLVLEVRGAPNGAAALALILRYIFVVSERFGSNELVELLVQAVGEEGKDEVASVADQLRAEGERKGRREGRVEGRVEGRTEGRRELLLRQLRARFGDLPDTALARVQAADAPELDLWAERVLSAASLAEVLEGA